MEDDSGAASTHSRSAHKRHHVVVHPSRHGLHGRAPSHTRLNKLPKGLGPLTAAPDETSAEGDAHTTESKLLRNHSFHRTASSGTLNHTHRARSSADLTSLRKPPVRRGSFQRVGSQMVMSRQRDHHHPHRAPLARQDERAKSKITFIAGGDDETGGSAGSEGSSSGGGLGAGIQPLTEAKLEENTRPPSPQSSETQTEKQQSKAKHNSSAVPPDGLLGADGGGAAAQPVLTTDSPVVNMIPVSASHTSTRSDGTQPSESQPSSVIAPTPQQFTSRFTMGPEALRSPVTTSIAAEPSHYFAPRAHTSTANIDLITSGTTSRTQQKLMLQRAYSKFDEDEDTDSKSQYQQHPRFRQESERVTKEYNNVRRFRSPLMEALARTSKVSPSNVTVNGGNKSSSSDRASRLSDISSSYSRALPRHLSSPRGAQPSSTSAAAAKLRPYTSVHERVSGDIERALAALWNEASDE